MHVREAIVFTGRVQGVGFRATARDLARALHLHGWVRNEPDGSVSMEVQGDLASIALLLERIEARFSRFPPCVQRDRIALQPETDFRILR
jgi:acylphosphatase